MNTQTSINGMILNAHELAHRLNAQLEGLDGMVEVVLSDGLVELRGTDCAGPDLRARVKELGVKSATMRKQPIAA